MGVVSLSSNLNAEVAAAKWFAEENKTRTATPASVVGPFYKRGSPDVAMMRAAGDPGLPLHVSGAVYSVRGEALPLAKIEIWQTNYRGYYDLKGYRYRALLTTGAKGAYAFDSVIPGHYPARVCQHVHLAVFAEGHKPLVTQMYFATDPVFDGDPDRNYSKDPLCTSRELIRPVRLHTEDAGGMAAETTFELVLERA